MGDPGKSVTLPKRIVENCLNNFMAVRESIGDLWNPEIVNPIPIPIEPNEYYYKNFGIHFTRSYFFKNLLKCLITLEILRYHFTDYDNSFDLGSGSGTFSVALYQAIKPKRLHLNDYSADQLKMAKEIFSRIAPRAEIYFDNSPVSADKYIGKDCVSSYAMSESPKNFVNFLEIIEISNRFTLLDTPMTIGHAEDYLNLRNYNFFSSYIEFSVKDDMLDFIEGGRGHFSFLHKSHERGFSKPWS
jgi:hypothetical protein